MTGKTGPRPSAWRFKTALSRREVRDRLRLHAARRGGVECECRGNRYIERLGPEGFAPVLEFELVKTWNGTLLEGRLRSSLLARVLKSFALSAATVLALLVGFVAAVTHGPDEVLGLYALIGASWAAVVGSVFTLVDLLHERAVGCAETELTIAVLRRLTDAKESSRSDLTPAPPLGHA